MSGDITKWFEWWDGPLAFIGIGGFTIGMMGITSHGPGLFMTGAGFAVFSICYGVIIAIDRLKKQKP